LRQTKDGTYLTICLHPSEIPQDVVADLIGTRYVVAMVKVNDQGEPEPGEKTRDGHSALAISQMLPRNARFQKWAANKFGCDPSQEGIEEALREACGISSRRELQTNENARKALFRVRDEFEEWIARGAR